MGGVLQSAFTFILSVEFIIGNLGNGFIVLVNCMDWVKRRNMSSSNPHCFGHLQNLSSLVSGDKSISVCAFPRFIDACRIV
jgi:hypothetical protein